MEKRNLAQKNANVPVHDGGNAAEHDSEISSDEQELESSRDRSNAMVFDRSLVGDRNGLKTAILKAVYDNQIHLQARKGEAFDSLADRLSLTEEFKQFRVHGRKLQKSFNKIARDIKDCIVAGNEPSRWGKEEPEFFKIARKIFDEARRAGIRAFDEKLKSKTIEDRLNEGDKIGISSDEASKKKKKRDIDTALGHTFTSNPPIFDHGVDWVRMFDEYLENKLDSIKSELAAVRPAKVPRGELEAGILRSAEQLNGIGIKSINDLLIQSGISEQGRQKITENCGFQPNDDISIFLLSYTDAISKDIHPVSGIREQFDSINARDASTLYSYIGKKTSDSARFVKIKLVTKMSKAGAQSKKNEGNTFFKNKQYEQAIQKYSEAIELDPNDVTFYSNRSACYAALNKWAEAAEDGRQCIITDKNFVKGYFRSALALQNLGNLDGALDAIKRGLGIDSQNADLKKMSKEIEEQQRLKKVEGYITAAEIQLKENDVNAAFRSVESGLRLDPNNRELIRLMDRVRPLYERAEKQRLASLDPKERIKEEGDALFKAAKFEEAIKVYSRCLDSISDKSSELALKCYNNRAACYKQISNFDGVIGDSTSVLEYKPDDVKALVRRAQAYEACERYKSALQDVRQVLGYGIDTVGKPTYDLCNGMQHRLNRVIQQLRC